MTSIIRGVYKLINPTKNDTKVHCFSNEIWDTMLNSLAPYAYRPYIISWALVGLHIQQTRLFSFWLFLRHDTRRDVYLTYLR